MKASDPAFPFTRTTRELVGGVSFPRTTESTGLTKREYFAGLVLAGISADAETTWSKPEHETKAKYSVRAADALIAELAKGEK